jgi:hypothetical protein
VTNTNTTPTSRQLTYLRQLARRTGTTFTPPCTRAQASAEIQRLKTMKATGFTFAELQTEQTAREEAYDLDATLYRADEVTGHGADCTWSHRS